MTVKALVVVPPLANLEKKVLVTGLSPTTSLKRKSILLMTMVSKSQRISATGGKRNKVGIFSSLAKVSTSDKRIFKF